MLEGVSKSQINRAGDAICKWHRDPASVDSAIIGEALKLMRAFRAAHQAPLTQVARSLRRCVARLGHDPASVAQRMKRATSISKKLGRTSHTRLETMCDLGGCRVVLPLITDVYALRDYLLGSESKIVVRGEPKDTMAAPDSTGYRALHLIAVSLNDRRVEIQVRSELQHSWATLVESFDRAYGSDFKHGSGPDALGGYLKCLSAAHFEIEMGPRLSQARIDELDTARSIALQFIDPESRTA